MKLDDVKSIKEIWKEAEKGGLKCRNDDTQYEYSFEGGERVAFTFKLSVFIESDPKYFDYYATNFYNYISGIKAAHAKGHIFLFTDPQI